MSDLYMLDERGEPVPATDIRAWEASLGDAAHRTLRRDSVGEVEVSTVFLGIDHGWGRGDPVLWETMTFGGAWEGRQWRYTSRADALAGHARVLWAVRSGAAPETVQSKEG